MVDRLHNIREASLSDLPGILALYQQPDYDGGDVVDLEHAARLFERMARYPFYRIHVACTDGRIIGTFALLVMDNIGHHGAPSAIVEAVAVAPDVQGQGLGAAMMAHAMNVARTRGCYKLALTSNLRRIRAHAFYDKLGFARHGVSFMVDLTEADHGA